MENGRKTDVRTIILYVSEIIIVVLVACSVISMVTSKNESEFMTNGIGAFRFYTVLSNLFCALSSLCVLIFFLSKKRTALPIGLYLFRLMGSCVVTVTLVVVLLFLGPTMGWGLMFTGVSLWLHLVVPVLSIVAQVLQRPEHEVPFWKTALAVAPTIVYGTVYVIVNAVGWTGKSNRLTDFYGFLTWGWGIGVLILLAICLMNWLAAILYWKLDKRNIS